MLFKYIKVKTKGLIEGEELLVPKLRFKEFNSEYKKYKIGDTLKVKSGKDQKSIECINGTYPILGTGGQIGTTNSFLYDKPSVLIGRKGTINKPQYMTTPFWTVDTLFYTDIKEEFNTKYIFYAFQNINWKKYDESTGVPSLSCKTIEEILYYIPNKDEQDKISTFITLLDKKIELQNQKIEALKIYKRGLIQRIYNRTWNNKIKMEEILIQKSIRNTNDEIQNVYSVSNKDGFILQTEQFKDRIVASEDTRNYKVVAKNDFAYNPARINVGSIARMKQDIKGIISPMYICFKCNEKILPEYLEYFFESSKFTYEMSKRLEGSVRMCLSYESMLNIPIELPNKNEQEKISTFLNSLSNKIKLEEKKFMELNKLKKGLLQKMFI